MISKPNTRSAAALLDPRAGKRAEAASFEVGGDAAQHLGEVGSSAAAGVEHVDVLRRQPVRDAEIVLQRLVHAGHHVADDFGGRVPDAQLLAQAGVEGFQERLVEIGHRLALVELRGRRWCGPPGRARRRSSPAPRRGRAVSGVRDRKAAGTTPAAPAHADAIRPHAS